MHDYKLKASLKIRLLACKDHARNLLPRADKPKTDQPLYVVVVITSSLISWTCPHLWICKAYDRENGTVLAKPP